MNRSILVAVAFGVAACGGKRVETQIRPLDAAEQRSVPTRAQLVELGDSARDLRNPAWFASLYEVRPSGERVAIALPAMRCPHCAVVASAEVDHRSRIEIRFDRQAMMTVPDLRIMVRADLRSDSRRTPVEVPGYSRVEEGRTPAFATTRSIHEIRAIGSAVSRAMAAVSNSIAATTEREQEEDREAYLRAERLSRRIAEARAEEQELVARAAHADSVVAVAITAWDQDGGRAELLGEQTGRADRLRTALTEQRNTRRALEDSLRTIEEGSTHARSMERRTPARRDQVLAHREAIESALRAIVEPDNRAVVEALAARSHHSTERVLVLARNALDRQLPELERSARLSSAEQTGAVLARDHARITELGLTLQEIEDAVQGDNPDAIRRTLLEGIRNTDLVLASTAARPGDVIELRVTNGDGTRPDSDLVVLLEVREFGLIRGAAADGFALLHRPGIDADRNQADLDRFQQALREQGARTDLVTSDSVVTVRMPHRWTPAYSLSTGWTYRHRPAIPRDSPNWTRWHNFVRWLEPSFGLQVALPPFRSERVTFRRTIEVEEVELPNGTVRSDTTVTVGEPERIEVSRGIDVALGGYVGGWNNLMTIGWGRHLTGDSPSLYWSIGVSFVRLAQTAIQSLGGPE
jgi:hypothetical protein